MRRDYLIAAVCFLLVLVWAIALRAAECPAGGCPPTIRGSVGTFGRAWVEPDGSAVLRGGLGGANVEINRPASAIVPVYFGGHSFPAAGVYVGVIRGRGVTLTCWHIAQDGVQRIGGATTLSIQRDKFGYDLAAVITEPLDLPVVQIGEYARQGATVEICGRPLGRFLRRTARVVGYFVPGQGQRYGDLKLNVAVQPGDSGGAVFNSNGQLVGLVWGTAADGSGSSVAVSAPAIRDFVDRVEKTLAEEDAEETPPPVPDPPEKDDHDELLELIRANAEAIANLTRQAQVPGPPGPKGDPGPPGAAIGPDKWTEEQIAVLAARLPWVRLQTVDTEGNVLQEASAPLGQPLRLRLIPVKRAE